MAGITVFIWLIAKGDDQYEKILNKWISKNNYELIERRLPNFWEISFWKYCKLKAIYIIKIKNSQGLVKKGHVVFGNCWRSVFAKNENIEEKVVWYK